MIFVLKLFGHAGDKAILQDIKDGYRRLADGQKEIIAGQKEIIAGQKEIIAGLNENTAVQNENGALLKEIIDILKGGQAAGGARSGAGD